MSFRKFLNLRESVPDLLRLATVAAKRGTKHSPFELDLDWNQCIEESNFELFELLKPSIDIIL